MLQQNIRLILGGLRVFLVFPQVIAADGRLTTSKIYKTGAILILLLVNFSIYYIYTWERPPLKIRNSYILFSYTRASFKTIFLTTTTLYTIYKSYSIEKLFNNVIQLQNRIKFTQKELKWFKMVFIWQIIFLFFGFGVSSFNMYLSSQENLAIAFLSSLCKPLLEAGTTASEFIFINFTTLLRKYIQHFQNELNTMIEIGDENADLRARTTFSGIGIRAGISLKKLKIMKKLYGEIYGFKKELQKVFSIILFGSITISFIEIVFDIFVNVIRYQYSEQLPLKKDVYVWLFGKVMFIKLYFITKTCESLKNIMKKTSLLVSRLWPLALNSEAKDLVLAFLTEIESMDPTITCYDFAVIDLGLFNSMIANICMYVVMLLQFQFPDYGTNPIDDLLYYS